MKELSLFALLLVQSAMMALIITNQADNNANQITTAIIDNGCSKQTQIELSQTKSNADVYNYAALSTSY